MRDSFALKLMPLCLQTFGGMIEAIGVDNNFTVLILIFKANVFQHFILAFSRVKFLCYNGSNQFSLNDKFVHYGSVCFALV